MKTLKMTLMAMFAILFLAACNHEEGDKKLTINVMLDGLTEASELYLQQGTETGYVVIDTAELTESQYVFETTIEQPNLLYITSAAFRGAIPVFAEGGDIQVKANVDSLANAVIKGSASHDFFAGTNKKLSDFDKLWQDFYYGPFQAMSKEDQGLNENKVNILYDSAQSLKARFLERELLNNGKQFATPVLALSNIDVMEIDAAQAILDKLDPKVLETGAARNMADRLSIIKRTSVGQPLIDFTMNNTDGNPITLSEYAAGKYVLVDFWAAWCAPCRRENPNVVANFTKFQDKGFTILGVSFDQKKENWIQAIADDGLNWEQVSDLQGWANAAGRLYGIQSIPQNILLDPNGVIIEKNLRGPALGEKLEELLGK